MSFGQRLRERRKELGYSQGELAKALGVSLSAISNYENGQNAMREDVLLRLFRVLNVEPNYLYQDSFSGKTFTCTVEEERLVKTYRFPGGAGNGAPAPGGGAADSSLPESGGGGVRFPGVWGGFRLYRRDRRDAPGRGVRGAHPGRFHGAVYLRWVRSVCKPRPFGERGCGNFLPGRGDAVQAVYPGRFGDGVSVLPQPRQV